MTFNYKALQKVADDLTAEFGMKLSATRQPTVVRSNGREIVTPGGKFSVVGAVVDYEGKEIDGTRIKAGDKKLVVGGSTRVKIGDIIHLDDGDYRVENPGEVNPAGVNVVNVITLRK